MKATKRIASLLLCGAMTLSLFPTPALAEVFAAAGERVGDARVAGGAFEVEGDDAGYSYSNGVLTVNDGANITISMANGATTPTSDRIVVAENATATITLAGVNIKGSDCDGAQVIAAKSAIDLSNGSILTIDLSANTENTLTGGSGSTEGSGAPGIHVPDSASLIIQGEGSLSVSGGTSSTAFSGVGIGGNASTTSAGEACGTVICFASGNVTITAGTQGSGSVPADDIGGGNGQNQNNGDDGQGIRPGTDGTYTVYGDLTLPCDVTIPQGATVTIPSGASLTVPEDVTLTNSGTILVQGGVFANSGTLTGNQPTYPSTVTVSFSQGGKPVASVPYGSTVTITATMERAETAANALSADTDKVDFYLGDANDTGLKMGTGTVEFEGGACTASVNVTINQDKGFNSAGTFKFTADFGGYAPEGDEGGDSLAPNTGSAQLTVVESYTIDYENETITIAEGYSLYEAETGGDAIFTSTAGNSTTSLTSYIQSTARTLYLQAPATGGAEQPDRREITIPARPAAPVAPAIDYSEEKLSFSPTVTETTLEYALSQSDPNWRDVPSGAALSEMGWDGTGIYIYFRTGATDSAFASEATQSPLNIPARPAAPNDLNLMDYTDVSVTYYVGAGVQCRLGNEGAWVTLGQNETDHTFTGLAPQTTYTVYARKPATESQFASAEASDEVTTKSNAAEPPEMTYEVTANSITLSYSAPWQYQTSDDEWISVEGSKEFTSLEAATEYTFTVRVAESETAEASKAGTLKVYTAHAAPTGVQGGANKITGVTADMEYKLSTAEEWTACGGTEVTGLAAGKYQVRHKADAGGAPASEAVTVNVTKGDSALDLTAKKDGEETTAFTYGDTITIEGNVKGTEDSANTLNLEQNMAQLYCGETPLGQAANVVDGSFTLTYDTSEKGIPIGSQTLTVRYGGSGILNESSGTVEITLGKKPVTAQVATERITKQYNGETDVEVDLNFAEGVLVGEDEVTVSAPDAKFSDPYVENDKEITLGDLVVGGDDAGWYEVSAPENVTGTIIMASTRLNVSVNQDGKFVYGDKIVVTFTPEAEYVPIPSNRSLSVDADNAVLYFEDEDDNEVVLARTTGGEDDVFALTYDTTERKLPCDDEPFMLYVKYGGGSNLQGSEGYAQITLEPAPLRNAPTVAGDFVYGETLAASYVKQDDETVTYQWYRGDQPIDGATGGTYTLTAEDIDKNVYVEVTATDEWHKGTQQSAKQVVARQDAELGGLTVSGHSGFEGHFQYGDVITVTFTPERKENASTNAIAEDTATLTYTNAEGEAVTLATATARADGSFELTYDTEEKKLPIGEDLTLTVSYGGSSTLNPVDETVALSLDKAILMNVPSVSGNFVYGETLTVNYTPQDDETVTYQWYRVGSEPGGETIEGATGPEYKLTLEDIGNHIYVNVRATDEWHRGSMQSTNQDVVAKAPGSIVIACESVTYGETVQPSVTSNTNTGADVTYSYAGTGGTSYGPSATAPENAGTYTVTATVAETATHTSATSEPTSFSINRALLATPQNLNLTSNAPGTATASWDAVPNASGYTVQLYKDEEAHGEPVVVTESGCEFSITEPGTYTVKVIANGSGNYADSAQAEASLTFFSVGFVIDGNGTASASVTTATMGDEVTLTAEPADGYHFAGWEVVSGNVAIAGGAFVMPASDVTVKAVFERHASTGAWQSDEGGHWKVCDACGERFLEAAHTPAEDDGDCTTAVPCTVCGFTVTPALGAHDYEWTSNLDGTHSGVCRHDGCDQRLLDQPCSYGEDGICSVCGYGRISVTTQPQDATVKEGDTATFSVAATGSNVASYQWQVSMDGGSTWADVAGATDGSYVTPAAVMDMDGWQYRCVVSNDGDRAESGVAALTVRKAASEVEPRWVGYFVEHYTQGADGGYDLAEREFLVGEVGKTVAARPKEYPGYAHNAKAEGTVATGTLESVTSASDLVVLRVYYDLVSFSVTVETDGQGTASSSLASATMGEKVTLTAEQADGYHFAGWEVVSGEVALDGGSFAMPAGDVTVRAVFEPHAYGACEPSQGGTHTRVCAVCGERQTEACSGGTATCATLATCALCGQPYGELAEHEPEVVGAKEATCTEDGYMGDTVCSVCGRAIAKGEVVPATGHDFQDGVCTVCGAEETGPGESGESLRPGPAPEEAEPEDSKPTVPETGDASALFSLPLALLGALAAGAGVVLARRRS